MTKQTLRRRATMDDLANRDFRVLLTPGRELAVKHGFRLFGSGAMNHRAPGKAMICQLMPRQCDDQLGSPQNSLVKGEAECRVAVGRAIGPDQNWSLRELGGGVRNDCNR